MELIMISDSKLKIMLTLDDMKTYSLDCATLDYDNTETRKAFWSILDEAKHRTGFDAASEKVFVQVYPSRTGGCEMYVTKLGIFADRTAVGDETGEEEDDVKLNLGGKEDVKDRDARTKDGRRYERTLVYRFLDAERLIKACGRLTESGYSGESSAYFCDEGRNGKYYLLIRDSGYALGREEYPFISEYADKVDSCIFGMYIGEHGKCICRKNAVKTLGRL